MPLIRDGRVIDDPWRNLEDDEALPAAGPVIVSLARWREEGRALIADGRPLGLRLDSAAGEEPALVSEDIGHFSLIVLRFAKFTDGRAYSHARLLRERYGFEGELRATGQVLRDQLVAMSRCGFDSFEAADDGLARSWPAAMGEISVRYQPTGDGRSWAGNLRRRTG